MSDWWRSREECVEQANEINQLPEEIDKLRAEKHIALLELNKHKKDKHVFKKQFDLHHKLNEAVL